jgi:hypothetical protein
MADTIIYIVAPLPPTRILIVSDRIWKNFFPLLLLLFVSERYEEIFFDLTSSYLGVFR